MRHIQWSLTAPPTRIPRPSDWAMAFAIVISSGGVDRMGIKSFRFKNNFFVKHFLFQTSQ